MSIDWSRQLKGDELRDDVAEHFVVRQAGALFGNRTGSFWAVPVGNVDLQLCADGSLQSKSANWFDSVDDVYTAFEAWTQGQAKVTSLVPFAMLTQFGMPETADEAQRAKWLHDTLSYLNNRHQQLQVMDRALLKSGATLEMCNTCREPFLKFAEKKRCDACLNTFVL